MENKRIIEKAIQKAYDNGWSPYTFMAGELANRIESDHGEYALIFSHKFAKALWGENSGYVFYEGLPELKSVKKPEDTGEYLKNSEWWLPEWKHHLQQMVISDDPIRYLGENM